MGEVDGRDKVVNLCALGDVKSVGVALNRYSKEVVDVARMIRLETRFYRWENGRQEFFGTSDDLVINVNQNEAGDCAGRVFFYVKSRVRRRG